MGISKPRVSKLKQEIDSRVQQNLDELREFIAIMMQAPEVFKEPLEDITQVFWVVREKNISLILDILKLGYLDNLERIKIVNQLSEKYSVDKATVYRNITEVSDVISQRINVLKILSITDLGEEQFKEEFEKIRELMG